MRVPDSSDKKKMATRIVLADKPFLVETLEDEAEVWQLKNIGLHGLQIDIGATKGTCRSL